MYSNGSISMKILLYYGLKTKNNQFYKISFYKYLNILNLLPKENEYYIICNSVDKKYIEQTFSNFKITYIDIYKLVEKIQNWDILFQKLYSYFNDLDYMICYFLPSYWTFNKDNFFDGIYSRILKNNKYAFTSYYMQSPYKLVLIPYYLINVLKINNVQLIEDPLQPIIGIPIYYNFNNYKNIEYSNVFEYIWCYNMPICCNYDKQYIFTFGMTANNFKTHRIDYINQLLQLQKIQNYNMYIYCKVMNIKTYLPYLQYNKMIQKSNFTLIIPSLFKDQVSLRRILQSIILGCIPLLHKDNNFDIIRATIPEIYELLSPYIIYNILDIPSIIKSINYIDLITKLQNCRYIKNIYDTSRYEKTKLRLLPG